MDGELAYYAGISGLTPVQNFSLMDHARDAGIDPWDFEYWAGLSGLTPATSFSLADHKFVVVNGGGSPDVTDPTAGTLTSSNITSTTFDLTVSGAADETALHAQPYRFSTDNGSSWSPYQASPVFNVTGKVASTAYTCVHETRDAAGNTSLGSSIVVNTLAAFNYAYTDNDGNPADQSSYSFIGKAIGAAGANRRVVVGITTNSTRTVSGVTIGGITASLDATVSFTGVVRFAFFSAVVPTGTTADVVITMDGNALGCDIAVWSLSQGAYQADNSAGAADPIALSVATAAGDAVLCIAFESGVAGLTYAWTGATERFDRDAYSSTTHLSAADVTAAGATTNVSADATSGTNQAGIAVVYRG